jgi:tRNA(Ile)-lysidine synthase
MRTHPPTLLTLARRALRDEIRLAPGSRILAATSGGPDSMALLDVLAALRGPLRFTLAAHGVDHGLRPGAAAELDLAEAHARRLDVPFGRSRVRVGAGADLQARARRARYAALERARRRARADVVATGHHADDRAETVLLRVLRGAGASGLAVLPPREGSPVEGMPAGTLVRPFVRARRSDVELHLARHRVPFARDPSNEDPRFLRTRVRRELLPLLEELDASAVPHLCALADDLAALREEGAGLYRIPRAARVALAKLAAGKTPRGTVLLPGGLVVEKKDKKKR